MPGEFYIERKKEKVDLSAIVAGVAELEQKLEALVVYRGETTAPGAADGSTLVCSDLAARPDYDGNLAVIRSGACIGQSREITGATTGGTVSPDTTFGGQILAGIKFAILGVRAGPAALKALIDVLEGKLDDGTTGLAALKALIDAVEGKLDDGTSGLAALKALIGALNDRPQVEGPLLARIRENFNKLDGRSLTRFEMGNAQTHAMLSLAADEQGTSLFYDGQQAYAGAFVNIPPFWGRIIKIDPAGMSRVAQLDLQVGENLPRCIVSDGIYLYVLIQNIGANGARIIRINKATFTRVDHLDLLATEHDAFSMALYQGPSGTADGSGDALYVGVWNETTSQAAVVEVSLASFARTNAQDLSGAGDATSPHAMVSDGLFIYAASKYVYKLAPTRISWGIGPGNFEVTVPIAIAEPTGSYQIALDGNYLYVGQGGPQRVTRIDTRLWAIVDSVNTEFGSNIRGIFFDGEWVFIGAEDEGLQRIDTSFPMSLDAVVTPNSGATPTLILGDERYLFWLGGNNRLHRIPKNLVSPRSSRDARAAHSLIASLEAKLEGAVTTGTFSLANNINEQDCLVFAAAKQFIDVELDMVNLTQKNTVREYTQTDGVNYREISAKVFPDDFDTGAKSVLLSWLQKNAAYKITLQASVLEEADRDVPYRYMARSC